MAKRFIQKFLGNGTAKRVTVVYDSNYGEYQVLYYFNGKRHPSGDYYTNDRLDALQTAEQMVK